MLGIVNVMGIGNVCCIARVPCIARVLVITINVIVTTKGVCYDVVIADERHGEDVDKNNIWKVKWQLRPLYKLKECSASNDDYDWISWRFSTVNFGAAQNIRSE